MRDHAGDRQQRADDVEPAAQPLGLVQVEERADHQHDADRHVDEQHPPPAEVLGQDAAEQQPERGAGAGHRGVDGERPGALLALLELGGDQRQRGRRGDRAAEALDRPGRRAASAKLVAMPARKLPRVNRRRPMMNIRRRPRMSPARPPSSSRPPKASV